METQHYNGGAVLVKGKEREMGGEAVAGTGGRRTTAALRLLAMLLTLAAAVTLGLDKQTKMVTVNVGTIALTTSLSAKSAYLSAFKYFVIVNSIAAALAALFLVLSLASKGKKVAGIAAALDIIIVALLYSAIGAAGAVGLLGFQGNDHLHWKKVCNVFDNFCHVGLVALGLSLLGSIAYLLIIFHSISLLHRRHN